MKGIEEDKGIPEKTIILMTVNNPIDNAKHLAIEGFQK